MPVYPVTGAALNSVGQRTPFNGSLEVVTPSLPDGSDNAPFGAPNLPTLLSAYQASRRPSWNVAGVNYRVGHPTNITLQPATAISIPGVSVTTSQVTISGNNVTLDGFDLKGRAVIVSGQNCTIRNCDLNGQSVGGTQNSVISGTSACRNLLVSRCTISGRRNNNTIGAAFLVEMQGQGLTIEYCHLKDSNADLVGRHGAGGLAVVMRYCLFQQAGMGGAGTHGDYLQVYGPNLTNTSIKYCTAHQVGGITQGFIMDNTQTGEFRNNVMIGDVSYWISTSGPNTSFGGFSPVFQIVDNYYDLRGALGFAYSAQPQTNFNNNRNLFTGAIDE